MSDDIGAIRRYLEANVGDLGFRYTLQQHLDRLETELNLRQASQNDYQAEVKRLREENKQLLLTKAGAFEVQMEYAAENERLRTEITGLREDDEAKQAEVERLRGLNDAGEPWHYSQHLGDQPLEAKDE